jgi:RluA family pseudouridine synthase
MFSFTHPVSMPPQRIEKVILFHAPYYTKQKVMNLLEKRKILINEKIVSKSEIVPSGSIIVIHDVNQAYNDMYTTSLYQSYFPKNIRYEDDDILILNKMPAIKSQADEKTHNFRTLFGLVELYLQKNALQGYLIHRLDIHTSGLIIFSKHQKSAQKMSELFREKKIQKKYLTLVKGKVKQDSGLIEKSLTKTKIGKSIIDKKGMKAATSWKVVHRFTNASLLEIILHTGKMHQIRAHMSSMGHPVAGDNKYGDPLFNVWCKKNIGLKHQFLHAYSLEFIQPFTQKKLSFEEPLPEKLFESVQKYYGK